MTEQDTQALVQALNRIADQIAAHLLWMREQKAAEDVNRTKLPPNDYRPKMLNGQWPRRDGNVYGYHPVPEDWK